MFSAPFLATLLDRVRAIVRRVVRPAVGSTRAVPAGAVREKPVQAPFSPVLRGLVEDWMSAKLRALSALTRRIEAGEPVEPPLAAPRETAARAVDRSLARTAIPPEERLPRGFGWMCACGPNVRQDGEAFAAWLNEPAMKTKVLAAPERMARLISPLLTATGQRRPDWFPERAKRARRSSQLKTATALPICTDEGAQATPASKPLPRTAFGQGRCGPSQPFCSRFEWTLQPPATSQREQGVFAKTRDLMVGILRALFVTI
jgi:hypothetical protein